MKNLLLLNLVIIVYNLIQGCSTDFEDPEPPVRNQYKLTLMVGEGGSVSPDASGTYDEGTAITITATPDEGYEFDRWEGVDSHNNQCAMARHCRAAIKMDSDKYVSAFFKIETEEARP
tara:strand:- start:110 stop:463 length:354 start_codon:yes stop_codon:yes gene_type:complete